MTNFADSTRSGNAPWPLAFFASASEDGDVTIARLSVRRRSPSTYPSASIAFHPSFYPSASPANTFRRRFPSPSPLSPPFPRVGAPIRPPSSPRAPRPRCSAPTPRSPTRSGVFHPSPSRPARNEPSGPPSVSPRTSRARETVSRRTVVARRAPAIPVRSAVRSDPPPLRASLSVAATRRF